MTNKNEQRKVPELRFPEFSGEIQIDIINNYFENIRNGFVGTATPYYTDNKGIMYLQSNNIKNGKINDNNLIYVDREFHELHIKNQLKLNDLLMVQSGHAGDCAVVSQKYVNANCHALIIMTPNNKIDTKYLSYYLQSNKGKKKLNHYITGNTIKHILASEIKKLSFPVVSLKEQKKIGEFFSKLDRQIELEEKKLALLEEQKKGYMQKIFSQELRFKDENGEEYPEWELNILKNIGTYTSNGVDKTINEGERSVKLLNYMDVYNHKQINSNNLINLMEVTANERQYKNNNVLEGDIFFTPSSETRNDIGKSITIFENLDRCVYSYHIIRIRPVKNKLNKLFSNYYFENSKIKKQLYRLAQGAQRYTLSKNNFEEISIELPCLMEQKKIGESLIVIDEKLRRQINKINKLKLRKKELLNKTLI